MLVQSAAAAACAAVLLSACGSLLSSHPEVVLPIRNHWDQDAILEVTEAPDEVEGRAVAVIAPPITVGAGEELTARIQAPIERWTLRLSNGDRGFLYSMDLARASADDADVYIHIDGGGRISLKADP